MAAPIGEQGKGLSTGAKWVIGIGILIAIGAMLPDDEEEPSRSTPSATYDDHPLSEANCADEAGEMVVKYPNIYSSESEYVAICSGASRDLADSIYSD